MPRPKPDAKSDRAANARLQALDALPDHAPACSYWCGFGCTMGERRAAAVAADKLVARLGPGWRPRVWENLGWHHAAVSPCGRCHVHPSSVDRSFTAYLNVDASGSGRWLGSGATPQQAVDVALSLMHRERLQLEQLGESLPPFSRRRVFW